VAEVVAHVQDQTLVELLVIQVDQVEVKEQTLEVALLVQVILHQLLLLKVFQVALCHVDNKQVGVVLPQQVMCRDLVLVFFFSVVVVFVYLPLIQDLQFQR
tara:strand:+ start:319 stop:621 length:303 start_codon:yes stop_codon:yes gene_type:complete